MPQCDAQPGIDDELDEQQEQPKKRDFKEVNANRTATKMAAALGVSRSDYERWKPGKKAAAVMAKAEPVKAHGGQREGAGRKAEVKEDNQGSESTLIEEPKKQKRDSASPQGIHTQRTGFGNPATYRQAKKVVEQGTPILIISAWCYSNPHILTTYGIGRHARSLRNHPVHTACQYRASGGNQFHMVCRLGKRQAHQDRTNGPLHEQEAVGRDSVRVIRSAAPMDEPRAVGLHTARACGV